MDLFHWIFIFMCYISHARNPYTRESNYAANFFANNTDRFRFRMDKLQPFGDSLMHNFTDNKSGVMFSGIFTNNTVLQREPHLAALYGTCDTLNTSITLIIHNTITQHTEHHSTSSNIHNGDWKIVLPETYPNGGNFVITAQCNNCQTNPKTASIYNITFGDVFLCSGQSNMNVELHFTFNRNYTFDNITQLHKYSNIRFFTKRPYAISDSISPYIIPSETDIISGKYQWHQSNEIHHLNLFSATCWYTAQSLVDKYNMSDIHFGLIVSAVDGSQIESWISNNTISDVCGTNIAQCPGIDCGGFYNGMLLPFINMTIKGVLWYQGENNIKDQQMKNEYMMDNEGYSCMQKLMIDQWRNIWSLAPNTTSALLPFGVVQLAAGTSEGNINAMPYFRSSQTMNYGILPNEQLLNVFMAQAYDVGDPWRRTQTAIYYPAPYDYNSTKWFLGPIHPRTKIYVGRRLAMGINKFVYRNDEIWSGPLMKSCQLNTHNGMIRVYFNTDMLYDEQVIVQPFGLWYDETLGRTVKYSSAVQLLIADQWTKMDGNVLNEDNGGYSIVVNVSNIIKDGLQIKGIRYAWSDSPCCGDLDQRSNACPMNMCPIVTSKSHLPAVPFQALIVDDKCQCFEPQKCDGTEYELPDIYNTYAADGRMSTTDIVRRLTIVTTEDNAQYICVMIVDEAYVSITGEYEKADQYDTYWTKMDDSEDDDDDIKMIFYNLNTALWNIGSIENIQKNLICRDTHINIESLIECNQWIDSELNVVHNVLLVEGECDHLDINRLYQQKKEKSFGLFDDNIKLTIFGILFECSFIGAICIYCVIIKQRNSRNRMELETLENLTTTDVDALPWSPPFADDLQ